VQLLERLQAERNRLGQVFTAGVRVRRSLTRYTRAYHSARSTSLGATRSARRAGIHAAAAPATSNVTPAIASTRQSRGCRARSGSANEGLSSRNLPLRSSNRRYLNRARRSDVYAACLFPALCVSFRSNPPQ
jgi:hypothetical protein